jgi:hypothetical protein
MTMFFEHFIPSLERAEGRFVAGPPEVGLPASGLCPSDRLLKENPQVAKRTLHALIKANRSISENRQERSYDGQLNCR